MVMKENVIKALAEALEMDAADIRPEARFRDFENYSSLSELSVLAMLDTEFSIEIEMKDFNKLVTVNDLIELVSSKQ